MEARSGSHASHFHSPSISTTGLRPQLTAGEVGEGRAVGNHMPSNYGRRGAWVLVQRQSLSLEDTERRNLGTKSCGAVHVSPGTNKVLQAGRQTGLQPGRQGTIKASTSVESYQSTQPFCLYLLSNGYIIFDFSEQNHDFTFLRSNICLPVLLSCSCYKLPPFSIGMLWEGIFPQCQDTALKLPR